MAVTVGNDEARDGLLTVLAMGADRAVHLRTDGVLDPLAIARLLAPVVREESPDLVLCGVQSSDAVNGATGVALAGLLALPRVGTRRLRPLKNRICIVITFAPASGSPASS